ncbi:MAG: tetratricopeptide repeat protein [Bryobacter sp.]|nr:tetratricopeptide repeat protein [Bryobacter sp.]
MFSNTAAGSRLLKNLPLALLATLLVVGCGKGPAELVREGEQLAAAGKTEEAALLLQKALQEEPENAEAHYQLGRLRRQEDRLYEASEHFRNAAKTAKAERQSEYQTALARTLLEMYLAMPASASLRQQVEDQARQIAGTNPAEASRMEGYLAVMDQRPEDAIRHFSASLSKNAKQSDVELALLQQRLATGDKAGAEAMVAAAPRALLFDTYYLAELAAAGCGPATDLLARYADKLPETTLEKALRQAVHARRCAGAAAEAAILTPLRESPTLSREDAALVGDYFSEQARWPEAREMFERAAQLPMKDASRLSGSLELRQSSALLALGENEAAAKILDAYLAQHPDDAHALGQRGLLRLNGDLAQADPASGLDDLRRAMARAEQRRTTMEAAPALRLQFVSGLLRLGLLAEAQKEVQALEREAPAALGVRLLAAELALRQGRPQTTAALTKQLLTEVPDLREATLLAALAQLALGQRAEAIAALRRLHAANPRDEAVAVQYAAALAPSPSRADQEEFQRVRTALLAKARLSQATRFVLAEISAQRGDAAAAMQQLETLSRAALNPRAALRLAELRLANGQTDSGCAALDSLATQEPKLPLGQRATWWALRGICLEMQTKGEQAKPEAIAAHRKAVQFQPDNPAFRNNLASALADAGEQLDEAIALAQSASQAAPTALQYQDTLAWAYYRKGNLAQSRQIYQQLSKEKELPANIRAHAEKVLAR